MTVRRTLMAGGIGLTTLLVVGGLLTALLPFEFSALVGLPAGVVAGLVVYGGLSFRERLATPPT